MDKNREKRRKNATLFNRGERKGRREGLATKTQRHGEKSTTNGHELTQVDTNLFLPQIPAYGLRGREGTKGTKKFRHGFTQIYTDLFLASFCVLGRGFPQCEHLWKPAAFVHRVPDVSGPHL